MVLKQAFYYFKFYKNTGLFTFFDKSYVVGELKPAQREILALPLTSAILPVLPLLKRVYYETLDSYFSNGVTAFVFYHLSWAEKNNDLKTHFYKYLFWQQW